VDVSHPLAPVVAAPLDLAGDLMEDVAVVGNYAYVAADDQGLRVLDVSNPLAPFEVGSETSVLGLTAGRHTVTWDGTTIEEEPSGAACTSAVSPQARSLPPRRWCSFGERQATSMPFSALP
jgi:hypothetical protein